MVHSDCAKVNNPATSSYNIMAYTRVGARVRRAPLPRFITRSGDIGNDVDIDIDIPRKTDSGPNEVILASRTP